MKKKIFVTAILVIALCCLLVIGVSASAYDENRKTIEYTDFEGNTHTVPVVKYDVEVSTVNSAIMADTSRGHMCKLAGLEAMADDSALCILKDTDGNLTAYPSWYIIDADGTAIYEIGYGYLNSISETTKKSYQEGAIVYMEFPQGMSYVRNNGVFCQKQTNMPYEPNVTEFHIPKTVTYIDSAFNSMQKLESVYIEEGSQITQIRSGAFSNSTVKYVQIENLTNLTSIDGFTNCAITGDLDFSNTQLVTISSSCFQGSKNIGKITLPDTVETIAASAFENCGSAYLASPYLPANLKSVGARFFAYNSNLLDTYIFPEGVTGLASEPFQDSVVGGETEGPSGKELNLVFLGEVTGVVYLNGNGHQKHAEKVTVYFAKNSLSDYNKNGFYVKPSGSSKTSVPEAIRVAFCEGTYANIDGNITGIEYIYITNTNGNSYTADMVNDATNGFDFANHTHFGPRFIKQALTCGTDGIDTVTCIICDTDQDKITPATGDHKWASDYNCATDDICNVCSDVIVEAISHALNVEKIYQSYVLAGIERCTCTNEGCQYSLDTEIPALFTSKGYSRDTTSTAIVLDIAANNIAIKGYIEYLEEIGEDASFVYGMVVSATDDKPLNDDGTAKEGAVCVEFENNIYSNIQIKIMGIDEKSYDVGVYCSGYVCLGNKVTYINGSQASETAQKVSYNSLAEE